MKKSISIIAYFFGLILLVSTSEAQTFREPEGISNAVTYSPMIRAGGILVDGGGFIGPNFINSWKTSESLSFGLGVGFEFLAADEGTMTFLPAFLDVRYQPFSGTTVPYLFGDVGYSVVPVNNDYAGGLMFSAGAGLKTALSSSLSFIFDIGYRYQYSADAPRSRGGRVINGLGVNLGISFD